MEANRNNIALLTPNSLKRETEIPETEARPATGDGRRES
jgi:hypothetical protein